MDEPGVGQPPETPVAAELPPPEEGHAPTAAGGPADRALTMALASTAVLLMVSGFALAAAREGTAAFARTPCAPVGRLLGSPLQHGLMSAGVLLLASIPALRVATILLGEVRVRRVYTAAAAAVVLIELLLGMASGL